MAKCILEDTITDNPSFSREQLIAALAAEIPSPLQAAEFKKRIASELEAASTREIIPPKSIATHQKVGNRTPETTLKSGLHPQSEPSFQLTQAVADRCQQELTRCIGPMAKYIVEDALDQNPQLSVPQLIDLLAAEIPNPQQASEFRQRLLLSLRA
jgi:serine/threonine-protein kinase